MTQYIATMDGTHPALALAELQRLLGATIEQTRGKYIFFSCLAIGRVSRLALTLAVDEVVARGNGIAEVLVPELFQPSYRLAVVDLRNETHKNTQTAIDVKAIRAEAHAKVGAKVDLSGPVNDLVIYILDGGVVLAKNIFTRQRSFLERKSHKLPGQHPTGMDPKMARAIINLSGKDMFHDPCCGSGGIVIEGAVMGLTVSGSDIVPEMIDRAQLNAQHVGVSSMFTVADALALDQAYPAIITDLPYGRNSALSADKEQFYISFFVHMQRCTDVLIVGTNVPVEQYLTGTAWTVMESFNIYLHKSLTRIITVLEKR